MIHNPITAAPRSEDPLAQAKLHLASLSGSDRDKLDAEWADEGLTAAQHARRHYAGLSPAYRAALNKEWDA